MKIKANNLLELFEQFPTEQACIDHLCKLRWPDGRTCPYCGHEKTYNRNDDRFICGGCNRSFSVRVGTIFEGSKLPLQKWFIAIWLLMSNRKGISSCALARQLGVRQKTAWSMLHRIRFALYKADDEEMIDGLVEVDEAYFGGREKNKHFDKRLFNRWKEGKTAAMGLRNRDGKVRLRHIGIANGTRMMAFIRDNVKEGAVLFTDQHDGYNDAGDRYEHKTIRHNHHEYVRGIISTNGIESVRAVLKRGFGGIYHHWRPYYMPLYLAEFEARLNMVEKDDGERLEEVLLAA